MNVVKLVIFVLVTMYFVLYQTREYLGDVLMSQITKNISKKNYDANLQPQFISSSSQRITLS